MKISAQLRLALSGGRSDRLRIGLTLFGSALGTLGLLGAVSVVSIDTGSGDGPYRMEIFEQPGLRPGVIVAVLLLCFPVLVFIGLCSRVGAPSRDRRLASFRLAGATQRDVTRILIAETGFATLVGSVVATFLFLGFRSSLGFAKTEMFYGLSTSGSGDRPADFLLLPVDVSVSPAYLVGVVGLVVIGSAIASAVMLRKVLISPFGVVRQQPKRPPRVVPSAMFVGGVLGLGVLGSGLADSESISTARIILALALFGSCVAGLMAGGASIAYHLGKFIAPRTSSPSMLIASRRMISAPYTASRASSALVLAVLIGSGVQFIRSAFLLGTDPSDSFYPATLNLIDGVLVAGIALSSLSLFVAIAEALVTRRSTQAVLAASGTPRSVLARAALAEGMLPLIPSVILAAVGGTFAARSVMPTIQAWDAEVGATGESSVTVPIPWERLGLLVAGVVVVCFLAMALSLVFLASSTSSSELRAAA